MLACYCTGGLHGTVGHMKLVTIVARQSCLAMLIGTVKVSDAVVADPAITDGASEIHMGSSRNFPAMRSSLSLTQIACNACRLLLTLANHHTKIRQ